MGKRKVEKYFIPTDQDQEVKIKSMLQMLELTAGARMFKTIYENIQKSKGTHLDFLENLLEKEIMQREENRVALRIQQAKFSIKATIDEFDFSFQPSIDEVQIKDFLTCRFVREGKNIIFLGPSGVGKTHLSIALGMQAIMDGIETRFLRLNELFDLLNKSDDSGYSQRLLRNFLRPRLLILDDIDFYEGNKNSGEFLFKLISDRYNNKLSTIFSSNKALSEWKVLFGTQQRAMAALDRILHRSEIINIDGDSYRMKGKLKHLTKTK